MVTPKIEPENGWDPSVKGLWEVEEEIKLWTFGITIEEDGDLFAKGFAIERDGPSVKHDEGHLGRARGCDSIHFAGELREKLGPALITPLGGGGDAGAVG
jgi:hypothetical protein